MKVNELSKEQLVTLQQEVDKIGGREAYVVCLRIESPRNRYRGQDFLD